MSYTPQDGFPYYFNLAEHEECLKLYSSQFTSKFIDSINEEKARFRYQPDKWSIKQIIGHITDHERIKIYRAFLMSRKESVQLWGYDQDLLVKNSRFDDLSLQQLQTDYLNVRKASISLIESFSERQFRIKGMARQFEISLEDFLKSIIGHEIHHLTIINTKYL